MKNTYNFIFFYNGAKDTELKAIQKYCNERGIPIFNHYSTISKEGCGEVHLHLYVSNTEFIAPLIDFINLKDKYGLDKDDFNDILIFTYDYTYEFNPDNYLRYYKYKQTNVKYPFHKMSIIDPFVYRYMLMGKVHFFEQRRSMDHYDKFYECNIEPHRHDMQHYIDTIESLSSMEFKRISTLIQIVVCPMSDIDMCHILQ